MPEMRSISSAAEVQGLAVEDAELLLVKPAG
jgi:hypothetical protein